MARRVEHRRAGDHPRDIGAPQWRHQIRPRALETGAALRQLSPRAPLKCVA
jgi:hypothetical protein